MQQRLDLPTALLLTLPPLLWAGNAVVGRMVTGLVPPIVEERLREKAKGRRQKAK